MYCYRKLMGLGYDARDRTKISSPPESFSPTVDFKPRHTFLEGYGPSISDTLQQPSQSRLEDSEEQLRPVTTELSDLHKKAHKEKTELNSA